jgi:CRP-like cAMP-binding protein
MDPGVDPALFARFVPLNGLSADSQRSLARRCSLVHAGDGELLFTQGDKADTAVYLVAGEVRLESAAGKVLATLRAGEPAAAQRLAHQSPRHLSARCVGAVQWLSVDASLLDVMLTWDQSGRFEVSELGGGADGGDWMTRLLQMRIFQRVPPSNLQAMFMRMQEVRMDAGQAVIRQGAPGDYFYVLIEGRCMVTREAPNQKPVRLAELAPGACFGEEALISDAERNATVIMLTRGRLMRLSKSDFRTLLNEPLTRKLSYAEGHKRVAAGAAQWLDVRLPSEYQAQHLPGSINLPLYMLRPKLAQLDPSMTYIVYCDTGRRSSVALFILAQKGFEAFILDGGWGPKKP